MPTPPAGYVTLFINTDKNNMLYAKYPDGSFKPYNGTSGECACDIASAWTRAVACALEKGFVNATEFQAIMDQGLTVTENSVTSSDGLTVTNTISVGSREVAP